MRLALMIVTIPLQQQANIYKCNVLMNLCFMHSFVMPVISYRQWRGKHGCMTECGGAILTPVTRCTTAESLAAKQGYARVIKQMSPVSAMVHLAPH
jgi:hypothetical protein